MKYILVYHIDEYPEMGGGLYLERFETIEQLDVRVMEIYNFHDIHLAGKVEEFKYKTVDVVTKIVREE